MFLHDVSIQCRGVQSVTVAVCSPARPPSSLRSHGLGAPALAPSPHPVEIAVLLLAGVDNVTDVGHRDGSLGDVGGDDELAATGRSGPEDPVLLLGGQGRVQLVDDEL